MDPKLGFCYVDDMIDGFISLMNSNCKPINIGNPQEFSILELANLISKKLNKKLDFNINLYLRTILSKKTINRISSKRTHSQNNYRGSDKTIEYFKN